MQGLAPRRLLELWETGRALHLLDQGVLAASAAHPEHAADVADWPLGRLNGALAALHADLFGPALDGWTRCLQCAEQLEFHIDVRSLAEGATATSAEVVVGARRYRLPTSRDLAAIVARRLDPEAGARALLDRCGEDHAMLDEHAVEAVGERLAEADPLAEILLRFDCPNCGMAFDEPLELAAFLWAELEAHARSLLVEVHRLARAYGWSEAEILALSPARRATYLELVQG